MARAVQTNMRKTEIPSWEYVIGALSPLPREASIDPTLCMAASRQVGLFGGTLRGR